MVQNKLSVEKKRSRQQLIMEPTPDNRELEGDPQKSRGRVLGAFKRPDRPKTIVSPSTQHLPLHLQLLAYVTQTQGATYNEMAVNFEVSVRAVRVAIKRLKVAKLVTTRIPAKVIDKYTGEVLNKRTEVHAVHPAIWSPVEQKTRKLHACDCFCGIGGFSEGLLQELIQFGLDLNIEVDLVGINHDDYAIKAWKANHPTGRECREDIAKAQPRELFPGGQLSILLASPSCVGFSRARGGKPVHPQLRTHAWQIVRWCRDLDVETIVVENVEDIMCWGPEFTANCPCQGREAKCKKCHGKGTYPDMVKDGSVFRAWVRELRLLGYTLKYDVLNAADYGDATSRRRFFLVGVKGDGPVPWPIQTHSQVGKGGKPIVPGTKPWVAVSTVIDWSIRGSDMLDQEEAHSKNTWTRAADGLQRYAGIDMSSVMGKWDTFKAAIEGDEAARRDIEQTPVKLVQGGTGKEFLVKFYGTSSTQSAEAPIGAIGAQGQHYGLVRTDLESMIVPPEGFNRGNIAHPVTDPIRTITAERGGELRLLQPVLEQGVLLDAFGSKDNWAARVQPTDKPIPTIPGSQRWGVLAAFMTDNFGENDGQRPRNRPITEPSTTVTSRGAGNLVQGILEAGFLSPYYGNSTPADLDAPMPTATGKARFGLILVRWDGTPLGRLYIEFRMLEVKELAAAMGFPATFEWPRKRDGSINKTRAIRMIGNAVAVRQSRALCHAALLRLKKLGRLGAAAA